MSEPFTRRNFIKAAGTTAGVMIASGWSPKSYAANEKVRVGLIGCGSQGVVHLQHGLTLADNIEVAALCDVRRERLRQGWGWSGANQAMTEHLYFDYREMLEKEPDLDAVVVVTPYKTHHQIVMDCLDAGKYVFCEKTMAHTVEACRDIVKKCHETGKFVQCGHQRRYNPEYNHALKGIVDGRIGRVAHIEAQWHRNTDWRRPLPEGEELSPPAAAMYPDMERLINWRIYEQFSGGMMSELATHHLDVINWFLGCMPKRVYGSGGIDYWRDGRDTYDNLALCYEYELTPRMHGFGIIDGKNEHMDMAKINRPYTVRVTWSGLLQNRYAGASMMVSGDTGSFEMRERGSLTEKGCYWHDEGELWYLDDAGNKITDPAEIYKRDSEGRSSEKELIVKDSVGFENELDPNAFEKHSLIIEMEMFAKHIKQGGHPRTNEMCGLMAAIDDIAGLEALATGNPVEIDPAWYTFDFETPNSFMYEGNDETPA